MRTTPAKKSNRHVHTTTMKYRCELCGYTDFNTKFHRPNELRPDILQCPKQCRGFASLLPSQNLRVTPRATTRKPKAKTYKVWIEIEVFDKDGETIEAEGETLSFNLPFTGVVCETEEEAIAIAQRMYDAGNK